MSKIKWFLKALALFMWISGVLGALIQGNPLTLIFFILIAVAYTGYRFYQGYLSGLEA
jgi:hypothetical protein